MKKHNIDPKKLEELSLKVQSLHAKYVLLEKKADEQAISTGLAFEATDMAFSELVKHQQMLVAYASGISFEEFKKQFDPLSEDKDSCAGCGGSMEDCDEDDDDDDDEKSEFAVDDDDDEDEETV